MDLLAITAQLFVINGTTQESGTVPGLISRPAPQKAARGREHDFLFAHLALAGPAQETAQLSEELVHSLAERFFASAGSVTSALRRAVLETNEQLLRHNLGAKALREGALSCAVLHGEELYTLQVGEGLAFLGHNFGVERLPVKPPQQSTPLGRSAGIDIRFAYHRLQTGDMMLLADPRMAHLNGTALAPVLVGSEIETGLDELLDIVGSDTARLLLVEFVDELPSTLPLSFQHSKKPAPAVRPPAIPAKRPQTAKLPVPEPRRAATEQSASIPSTAPTLATVGEGAVSLETSAKRAASSSARALSRAVGWLADVIGLLRPGGETQEAPLNWTLPAMAALLIPIVIAAVITSVYLQRGTIAEVAVIKQQMVDAMLQAEQAGDPAAGRVHYERALALAAEAETLRPNDAEVLRMRSEARDALDRVDGVTRLSARTLFRYEDEVELAGIALRGTSGGIAVLDRATNRVLYHATDDSFVELTTDEPSIIAYGNQPIGTETVGTLIDIIWLPGSSATTRDGMLMLDRQGALFNFYPNLGDIRSERLPGSSSWVEPIAMATYLGRLYVLDRGAQQVWKYFADNGFTQSADDLAIYFSAQASLDGAVDFDLYSEDGSMIVLYGDGRIRYYDTRSGRIQWDEATLLQNGLGTPFVSPVAVSLVGRGLNASVYVLDPGSGRLVQLSRGGTVLTQFRVLDEGGDDVLRNATGFAVLDSPLSIFVVAGNQLYVAQR